MHTTKLNTQGTLALCWELPEAPRVILLKEHCSKGLWRPRHLILQASLASGGACGAVGAFGPVGRAQAAHWTLSGCWDNHLQEFRPPSLALGEKGRELARLAAWLLFQPAGERGSGKLDSLPPAASMPDSTQNSSAPEGGMCQDILQGW